MSYNITNIDTLYINATMSWKDVHNLVENHKSDLPEICFLEDLNRPQDIEGNVYLTKITWAATWSGRSWDFFQKTVAPLIKGEVQGIVSWEGGDSIEGFGIKDGKFYSCDVVQRLDLPEGFTKI